MNDSDGSAQGTSGSWRELFVGRIGVITGVLSTGMTLFAINTFVVATIMPTVVRDLGGVDFYSWAFSLFSVGAIVGAASAGPLRDALGARRSYALASVILAIGLTGGALAPDMPSFVATRLLQGIGGGAVASQSYGLVALLYPRHLQSRMLSVISTIWGVATVAGPGYGGVFAEGGLWRAALWSLVPLAIGVAVVGWRYIAGGAGHGRLSEMPYWRLALLAVSVLLLSVATLTNAHWLQLVLVAVSIGLAAVAFVQDARAERNMFPRQATAVLTEIGAAYWVLFLASIVLTFVNTYTTYYLQALHGIAPFTAGYLFSIQSLMWTVGALAVATVPRTWEVPSIVAGLALILVACVAIALTVVPGPVWAIAVAMAISGTGIGLMNNPLIQRIITAAPEAERHVAGTSVQTVRNIGVAYGAAACGMVAAAAGLIDGAPRAVVADAMQWVYRVNVVFAALSLVMVPCLVWGKRGRRD
ncbi:MAG: MFS transporter [Rhodospirillales bacterium]